MAELLSDEWLVGLNADLAARGPAPEGATTDFVLEVDFTDGPDGTRSLYVRFDGDGARATFDEAPADATLRLRYDDAALVGRGDLSSITALGEGRVKVRGDVPRLVSLLGWLES